MCIVCVCSTALRVHFKHGVSQGGAKKNCIRVHALVELSVLVACAKVIT